jgi:hypothetical protein
MIAARPGDSARAPQIPDGALTRLFRDFNWLDPEHELLV